MKRRISRPLGLGLLGLSLTALLAGCGDHANSNGLAPGVTSLKGGGPMPPEAQRAIAKQMQQAAAARARAGGPPAGAPAPGGPAAAGPGSTKP